MRQSQCGQCGARAWIAHSKLSKVCRFPSTTTSNVLSYSFSQTSHVAIQNCFACAKDGGGVALLEMSHEPVAGQLRHLLERARLFEQIRRSGHDVDLAFAIHLRAGLFVQLKDHVIFAADDE